MAEAGGIRAGSAYVELGVRDKTLAGLARVGARFKAWGAGIRATGLGLVSLGAAITVPLIAAAKASAASGAALYDMSKRTGISVERLSTLGYAADQTGASLEEFEIGVKRMAKALTGTDDAMEGTSNALKELKITVAEIKNLSPDQQFDLVAEKMRNIKNPTEQAATALKIFGRSGTSLLPLINDMGRLEQRAKDFGFEKSTESAKAGKEFTEALYDATRASKSLWNALSSGLLPMLKKKAEWLTRVTLIAREWVKQNKDLVVLVFEVAFAVGLLGTSLVVLGTAFSLVGGLLTGIATTFGVLVAVLTAASSPVTIIVTALTGLVGVFLLGTDAGLRMFDVMAKGFEQLKRDATTAWGGIVDAIAAGDLKLAMQIAVAFMKLEFEKGVAFLNKTWLGFKQAFLTVAYGAFYGMQAAFEQAAHGIEIGWIETVAVFKQAWAEFATFFQVVWNDVTTLFQKGAVKMLQLLGKFTPETAAAASAAIDAASKGNEGAILDDRQKQVDQIEKDRAASRAKEDKQHAATLAGIGQGFNDATSEVDRQLNEDMAKASNEIAGLKQQLDDLRTKAAEEREFAGPPAKTMFDSLAGAMDGAAKSSSIGTFSSAAGVGLGPTAVLNRIAKAAEGTEKNTENLMPAGGMVV